MGLNISKGNMYDWITHTWNTVKGECYHDCTYCYMKRWGHLKPIRFDHNELKIDLGENNYIFVGSSCDMFAENVHPEWIIKTLSHCEKYNKNGYLLQTKNPKAFSDYAVNIAALNKVALCITLESNRFYPDIMKNSPTPIDRVTEFSKIPIKEKFITIEPIMDFDLIKFIQFIKACGPIQVNIGADSGGHKLPEPPKEKVLELIKELEKFTKVKQKKNLSRILNN